jgi:hypothetical protein
LVKYTTVGKYYQEEAGVIGKIFQCATLEDFVFYRLVVSDGGNRGIFGVLKKLACILRIY